MGAIARNVRGKRMMEEVEDYITRKTWRRNGEESRGQKTQGGELGSQISEG